MQIRKLLAQAVGQDTFAVWFASIELIAIDSDGALVLDARVELRGWLHSRFSRVIADTAQAVGRVARIADATQSAAIGAS